MKTFQKLLTNSLLFADTHSQPAQNFTENRLCHKEGTEKPSESKTEAPKKSADGKFEVGQAVDGFACDEKNVVTEIKTEGGKEIIVLKDETTIQKMETLMFQPKGETEKVPENEEYVRKMSETRLLTEDGEDINGIEFIPAQREEVEKEEVMEKCRTLVAEKRKDLEQKLDKIIEETADETGKEGAKESKEKSLKNFDEKTKTLLEETEKNLEIKGLDADKTIQATAAAILEQFPELADEKSKEAADDFGAKAAIEGSKINDPEKLFKWLEDPANKKYMRSLAFPDWNDGAGKATVNFKNVQDKLELKQESYKVVVKYLRIGNLFEDADIKKIISVKLKGRKTINAKYFSKGYDGKVGAHVKGLYAENFKYLAILDGTEIEFGSGDNANLSEIQEQEMAEFGPKVEGAKVEGTASASAETPAGEAAGAAAATSPMSGSPAAAEAVEKGAQAGAKAGATAGAEAASTSAAPSEATSADAAKALGQVDQMPTIEGAQEEKVLPKVGEFLRGLIGKGATKLTIASYKNIDNWTKEQLGLAANATAEEVTAAREKAKEQARAVYDKYLDEHTDNEKGEYTYKEFYETLYGSDFAKVPQNPKVFAKYLDLTGKTILTGGVTGNAVTWGGGDVYFKAFIDNTKQPPIGGDISRATELTAGKKDFVKKIYTLAKASTNPVAKIWALELGNWLSENKDPEAQSEKKANFEKLRTLANDKATSPEDRIRFIETIKNTKEDELQAFSVGKEEFEKECKENLAQAYFDMGDFENSGLSPADLKEKSQKEFVEAFKDPSTIYSRAQLKGILETPGVKPEAFVKMAEKIPGDDAIWIAFEIYLSLKMDERIKGLAGKYPDFYVSKFYLATLEQSKEKRQEILVSIVSRDNFGKLPKDFQMTVMEALLKEGIPPALFKALNDLAREDFNANIVDADANAILRAKLMQARLEMAQGQNKEMIGGQRLAELGLGENTQYLVYNPGLMIWQAKDYFDAAGDSPPEADYALLKELHDLYNGETARNFEEDLKDDPDSTDSKKSYASLMYKLFEHTKDQKYLKGIDQDLLSEFGDAKFIESQGDKLYQQALQEADPAKRMDLMSQAADAYLQSAGKEKEPKKKLLSLSSAYSIALENGDSALTETILETYESLDDQEAQEATVDIYFQRGDYQKVAELLKTKDKISLPFALKQISALVEKDFASLAEDVCEVKGWYNQLIDLVYRVGEGKKLGVKLGLLISTASNEAIFDLLKDDDGRTKDSFTDAPEEQKKAFCLDQLAAIKAASDGERKRILKKLDITDLDAFVKEVQAETGVQSTEPGTAPVGQATGSTQAQSEQPAEPAPAEVQTSAADMSQSASTSEENSEYSQADYTSLEGKLAEGDYTINDTPGSTDDSKAFIKKVLDTCKENNVSPTTINLASEFTEGGNIPYTASEDNQQTDERILRMVEAVAPAKQSPEQPAETPAEEGAKIDDKEASAALSVIKKASESE